MKIEAGKRYVTRDGERIAGPIGASQLDGYAWEGPFADGGEGSWREDGAFWKGGSECGYDLVSEYVEPAPAYTFTSEPSYLHFSDDVRFSTSGALSVGAALSDAIPCDAYDTAAQDALAEVRRAKAAWPGEFNSAHEGFAIINEEFDELRGHVWMNQKRRDLAAMRKEAIQVAAMALRFAAEVCDETRGRR